MYKWTIKQLRRFALNRKRSGLSLVEVLTSLVIIAVTATAVTIGFYTSHTMLEIEKRKHIAIKFLEEEMEYWRLRVHTGEITARDLNGTENSPREIDFTVDGDNSDKNVKGIVYLVGIEAYNDIRTTAPVDYYRIKCRVNYTEKYIDPVANNRSQAQDVVFELSSTIIPANI